MSRRTDRRAATRGITRPAIEWPTMTGSQSGGRAVSMTVAYSPAAPAAGSVIGRSIAIDSMSAALEVGPEEVPAPGAVKVAMDQGDVHARHRIVVG